MSAPTHILTGTTPEDDKHLSYAYRRHTHAHTHFVSWSVLPGLACVFFFYFMEPICTFE